MSSSIDNPEIINKKVLNNGNSSTGMTIIPTVVIVHLKEQKDKMKNGKMLKRNQKITLSQK